MRSSRPKYTHTWDSEVMLSFFKNSPSNEALHLQQLGEKIATLLALSTAHRLQTFSMFKIDQISQSASKVETASNLF